MLLVLAPWFVFASSSVEPIAYAARGLLLLAVAYTWLNDERASDRGITLCIAGIVLIGMLGADPSTPSTWISVAQFTVLWGVLSQRRHVDLSSRVRAGITISLVLFAIAALLTTILQRPDTSSGVPSLEEPSAFGPFGNPNALGLAGLAVALWSILLARAGWRSLYAVAVACCGVVFLSGSRTAMLGMVIFLAIYVGATRLHSKWLLGAALAAALLAVPVVTAAYAEYGAELAQSVDAETVLDKGLLTGRQVIWPIVLAQVSERPLAGYGLGRFPGGDLPGHYEGLSAHNGFLQVLYQGGVIALALYVCLLVLVAKRAEWRASPSAVLCVAIVCELFEVLLTQNHFGIGIVFWILATTTLTAPPSSSALPLSA